MKRTLFIYTALLSAFLISCLPDIGRKSDIPTILRVMSFNVRHGTSISGEENLEKQAAIIKAHHPDLAALQEIDKNCTRSGTVDQSQRFAERTSMEASFGAFMPYDGGEYGQASLSKLKIIKTEYPRLPEGAEPKTAVIQIVELTNGRKLAFVNVHFDWTAAERRLPQAKAVLKRLDELKTAAIIAGDYNAEPGSPTIDLFEQAGFRTISKNPQPFTFDAKNPSKELDHIYVRNSSDTEVKLEKLEVINEPEASDHRPVLGIITVRIK
jgi:endonuclease/exonuclease/phosphatase family metal-dependent hydrolase